MTAEISIYLVGKQWVIRWVTPDGIEHRAFYGSRLAVREAVLHILTDVRGETFPEIRPDMGPPSETIELKAFNEPIR